MSFFIDNDVKDRVRVAVDIVDLVGSTNELRRQGRGFVTRCLWHDDRKPSLQINPERQIWKCWVCDIGGDVFSWVMQREGVTFPEALRILAERAGVSLEPMQRAAISNTPSLNQDDKKALYDCMDWVVRQYHDCFLTSPEAESARRYLRERGLTEDSVRRFRIGFAPDSWNWLLDKAASTGIPGKTLEAVNAATKNDRGSLYDRFRGRLMFPIFDPQGKAIALGGRVIPGYSKDREQAKYINSTETRLYRKSQQLYGLDLARDAIRRQKTVIVVEGYTDVIMSHQHDVTNTVAVCGTSLGEGHIRLLRGYCDSVILLLDGDEAGQKRTNEILELFVRAQMDLRVLTLPNGLDPCDYLIQNGGPSLRNLLGQAVDALEHKIRVSCSGFDRLTDTHRANAALEDILATLARAPRPAELAGPTPTLRRDQILIRLARDFGVAEQDVRGRLLQLQKSSSIVRRETRTSETKQPEKKLVYADLTPVDRELFEVLVLNPDIVPMALERFTSSSLGSDTARHVLQVYIDLELAGYSLDFGTIMSAVEDASLKSLLVSIEQEASQKSLQSKQDGYQRFSSLCEMLANQSDRVERQQSVRVLESKQLDEKEEMDLLLQVLDQARVRQGLFPPKG